MYGDDYESDDPERYAELEQFFDSVESRSELAMLLMVVGVDKSIPRPDLHVLHKRACIKKGWE